MATGTQQRVNDIGETCRDWRAEECPKHASIISPGLPEDLEDGDPPDTNNFFFGKEIISRTRASPTNTAVHVTKIAVERRES